MMLVVSCGCGPTASSTAVPADDEVAANLRLLTGMLEQELQRQGKDIGRVIAAAPSGEDNYVFDLTGQVVTGTTSGVRLDWTERLIGDYDQNSEVSSSDLQPLAVYLDGSVAYDDPALHDGIDCWPAGDPDAGGALNWRKARVDGDSNTEIGRPDIVPIAQHYGERLAGYRIYRQAPGETAFSMLLNPTAVSNPMTIERISANYSSSTPVRYTFTDKTATSSGEYRYRVAPYDSASGEEGPVSVTITVDASAASVVADFTATPQIGRPPLNVSFDASGSSASTGITQYEWDFDGGETYDETGTSATTSHEYTALGTYTVTLRVTDAESATDTTSKQIQVVSNIAPDASFTADPTGGAAPLDVSFNASASTDSDGTIAQYEWDFNGDLTYDETNTAATASYQYDSDGNYTVTLRVTDNEGATDTATTNISVVTTHDPPTANLTVNPASGAPPLKVTLWNTGSTGTGITFDYDFDGDGTYEITGDTDNHVQHTYDTEGVYHPVLRVVDDVSATDTDTKTVTVSSGPLPPTADLTVTPGEGNPTLNVSLDASGSTSATGTINKYEWDWEGDGTYDSDTGTTSTTTHNYTKPGYYSPTVRVTDTSALTGTASDSVTVHGWSVVVVDKSGQNGMKNSLCVINGHPALAYDCYFLGLRYCRSTDEYGGNWPEATDIEHGNADELFSGQFASLQEVDGRPAIAFCNSTDGFRSLSYIRASDANGDSWPASVSDIVVANVANSEMLVVDGNPAIVYQNVTSDNMQYIRATDSTGSSWGSPVVAAGGGAGYKIEFKIINGNPAAAYQTTASADLYYVRASNSTGSSWGSPVALDTTDTAGHCIGLDVMNGVPKIIYTWRHVEMGNTWEVVYSKTSNDANGSSWASRVMHTTPPPGSIVHTDIETTFLGGIPYIGYAYTLDSGSIRTQSATDATGSSWNPIEIAVDDMGVGANVLSIGVVNGKLAVAYYSDSDSHLAYAIYL
ncbi:MAG: PKD domain-containing protein [Anaerolineae bacterium]|nr:PKD domain-containing protein [Anaerolineae bacterium]